MDNFLIASESVLKHLKEKIGEDYQSFMIVKVDRMPSNIGWVFYYTTEKFLITGNPVDGVGGNSPIIYDQIKSKLFVTGTARPINYYIKKYIEDNGY